MTTEVKTLLEVKFVDPWIPGVGEDYEDAYLLRVYDDGVWEFLNKEGNPICQGVDAKFSVIEGKPK
jgi:hypothetical protein